MLQHTMFSESDIIRLTKVMNHMAVQEFVSWEDIVYFAKNVANRFYNKELSGVCGLSGGGLVLAVIISNALQVPLLMMPAEHCLIVYDIYDTDEKPPHRKRSNSSSYDRDCFRATMYCKEGLTSTVDYYFKYAPNLQIKFPWELL